MTESQESADEPSRTLVERARAGDRSAQDALLKAHMPSLRAFVRLRTDASLRAKESATDILQSTCREVIGGLDRFEYRNEASLRAWLHTVTLNKIREKRRYHFAERRRPDREDPVAGVSQLADVYNRMATPSGVAVHEELVDRVEAAFDELKPEHREVISLSRIVGLPTGDVARQMGRSEDAVRQLRARALVKLSSLLGEQRAS